MPDGCRTDQTYRTTRVGTVAQRNQARTRALAFRKHSRRRAVRNTQQTGSGILLR
jgi:hypothetical protein